MENDTHRKAEARKIVIFDTTLRDGEQSPGASMNIPEKLEVARALVDLGVDVIEAGFPVISPGDFQSVEEVSKVVDGASVCGLARCVGGDIDAAGAALAKARQPRIHVFIATSPIHRQYKLKMSKEQVIERAVAGVKRARNFCDDVEFSPEDGSRTEIDYLCRVVEAVIAAGAKTVNIPDTVGYDTPQESFDRIAALINRVPNIDQAILSVHCHNDLGMAVANALAAVAAGAGQIECTINGLGERAGNSALEEVVMAMRTRSDIYHVDTNINSLKLVPTSRLVSRITGLRVPRNKAIVGRNAFAHEAGIHQDGILKERTTYEIMSAESVGFTKNDLVLGKHSGRAALADRLKHLGIDLQAEKLDTIFAEFKKLADRKKCIYDSDIVALVSQFARETSVDDDSADNKWRFVSYSMRCGQGSPSIRLTLSRCGAEASVELSGDDLIGGPVNMAFEAVKTITCLPIHLKEFKLEAVSDGEDAQADIDVMIEKGDPETKEKREFPGRGVSVDVVEGAIRAVLDAINRDAPAKSAC